VRRSTVPDIRCGTRTLVTRVFGLYRLLRNSVHGARAGGRDRGMDGLPHLRPDGGR